MNSSVVLRLLFTSPILLIGGCLCTSTTFRVFDKNSSKHPFAEKLHLLPNSSHELVSELREYQKNNCTEVLQSTNFSNRSTSDTNGFVKTIVKAYNRHNNIIIRPDDVWAAIMTQFSFYVNKNAEEFREKFVNFEGKKELTVSSRGSLRNASYDFLVDLMAKKIDENLVDPKVKAWVLPKFSTTTKNDVVSIGVVFMATFKKYFNSNFGFSSAIPYVTLEGTVEDWKDIQGRLEKLKEYKLERWYDLLFPVLGEFVKAKEDQVDLEFWKRIVHYAARSGSIQVSGWITVFSVFDRDGNWIESKPVHRRTYFFNETVKQEYLACQQTYSKWPRIYMSDISSGIVEVDVKIDDHGVKHEAVLLAGHLATEIKEDDVNIQPVLSWAIALKSE
ncbi:unnamed protein product [Orchesella dallaii]|uniref:Uncharacterized protein n=1 Tax=Orchesella dallaii TaxID=48710 RepID=A0ABP1PZN7_9HEXA